MRVRRERERGVGEERAGEEREGEVDTWKHGSEGLELRIVMWRETRRREDEVTLRVLLKEK